MQHEYQRDKPGLGRQRVEAVHRGRPGQHLVEEDGKYESG